MAQSTFQFLVSDAVGSGDGGVDADRTRKTDEKNMFANLLQTSKKSLQTNLGIQLSVAAVLKQSQIFTGFIGSLFQILGAFVDVALMSVFPILKSSLKFLMKFFLMVVFLCQELRYFSLLFQLLTINSKRGRK